MSAREVTSGKRSHGTNISPLPRSVYTAERYTQQRTESPVATLETRNTRPTAKLPTRGSRGAASSSSAAAAAAATTDVVFTDPRIQSYVHAEWDVDPSRPASGMAAEVVVRVQDPEAPRGPATTSDNGTATGLPPYPVEESPVEVIVRAEEVLLVVLVLVIWVAAIALFFNRWGKIRMLEPYQPKFQQQHRTSCPMGESVLSPQVSVKSESEKLVQRMKHQRMSFSKYNVNCMGDNPMYTSLPSPNPMHRVRQNSVFVGSSTMAVMNPPRRVKSAIDIQHMVLSDYSPGSLSGCSSLLPMLGSFNKRPSITIEKVTHARQRRQSSAVMETHHGFHLPSRPYNRRPSCLIDRPHFARHRHFISFDQPTTSWDRRTSITIERPSSRKLQTLNFEHSSSASMDQPSLIIEPPSTSQEHPPVSIVADLGTRTAAAQHSCPESMVCLHQPPSSNTRRPSFHLDMPGGSPSRHRLSASLDNPAIRMERRSSEAKSLRSPCSTSFDETQIKLSNLEHSKVSDV